MENRGPVLGRRVFASFVVFVALVGSVSPARAECSRGTRPPTIAEKNFQFNTLKALKAAMPSAPDGWRVVEETDVRPPRLACIGQERQPLWFEYRVRFAPAAGAPRAGAPDARPAAFPAAEAGDAQISIVVNARRQPFTPPAEALDVSGVTLAFRAASAGAISSVQLLFGDWSIGTDDDSASPGREALAHFVVDVPYTKVQSLAVQIEGDNPRVDALVARLNLAALGALLNR